jgi:hypothetical protein
VVKVSRFARSVARSQGFTLLLARALALRKLAAPAATLPRASPETARIRGGRRFLERFRSVHRNVTIFFKKVFDSEIRLAYMSPD